MSQQFPTARTELGVEAEPQRARPPSSPLPAPGELCTKAVGDGERSILTHKALFSNGPSNKTLSFAKAPPADRSQQVLTGLHRSDFYLHSLPASDLLREAHCAAEEGWLGLLCQYRLCGSSPAVRQAHASRVRGEESTQDRDSGHPRIWDPALCLKWFQPSAAPLAKGIPTFFYIIYIILLPFFLHFVILTQTFWASKADLYRRAATALMCWKHR